jgi:aminopeptidase
VDFAEAATMAAIGSQPEVLFTITRESLGNDPAGLKTPYRLGNLSFNHLFYFLIASHKARGAWCPAADADTFSRTVPIDYPLMWSRAKRLKNVFDKAKTIHITTPAGTDLLIDLRERDGMLDDGDYRTAGTGGNLPAGEVFAVPNTGSRGVAVIDGSAAVLDGTLRVKKPFAIQIDKGKVVDVRGGKEADLFRKTLDDMQAATRDQIEKGLISQENGPDFLANCRNLAEFGIGLNPAATIVGNMTEDEKVLNTCHIAIGDDCYGYAPAVAHLDVIMMNPELTVVFDAGITKKLDPLNPPEI